MISIKPWQIVILVFPIAAIAIFLLVAAGSQIHDWGINWIWGVVVVVFTLWRWLLVKWTKSPLAAIESAMEEINGELAGQNLELDVAADKEQQINDSLQQVIAKTKTDEPIWSALPESLPI